MWTKLYEDGNGITYGCDTGNGVIIKTTSFTGEALCFVPDVEIDELNGKSFITDKKTTPPPYEPEPSGSKQKSLFDEKEVPMMRPHDPYKDINER